MADRRLAGGHLALVIDTWRPQINGVVTTMAQVADLLAQDGLQVSVVEPSLFRSFSVPRYPEVKLSTNPLKAYRILTSLKPDYVHIATEGPLGTVARFWCRRRRFRFTTSYHTRFPQYLKEIYGIPTRPVTAYMRWFHGAAEQTLVPTIGIKEDLQRSGFKNVIVWDRGVDTDLFHPGLRDEALLGDRSDGKTRLVYVGRVSKEKSVEDFCRLADLPGYSCCVVGDGPQRRELEDKYGDRIAFVGYQLSADLARYYASADVMVFPSRTDTFGNVVTESMAAGTPVAAYPVMGPKDVIADGVSGALDEDLERAVQRALACDRNQVREYAMGFSWKSGIDMFKDALDASSNHGYTHPQGPGNPR